MSGSTPTLTEMIPDRRTLKLGSNVTNTFSYYKDPQDQAWYAVTFDEQLASIDTVTPTGPDGDGTPLLAGAQVVTSDKLSVALWLTGGTAGNGYAVRLAVTTLGGDKLFRTAGLMVANL